MIVGYKDGNDTKMIPITDEQIIAVNQKGWMPIIDNGDGSLHPCDGLFTQSSRALPRIASQPSWEAPRGLEKSCAPIGMGFCK